MFSPQMRIAHFLDRGALGWTKNWRTIPLTVALGTAAVLKEVLHHKTKLKKQFEEKVAQETYDMIEQKMKTCFQMA
jgi:hypothetical protein